MKPQSSKIPPVGDEAYVYDKNGNMIEDTERRFTAAVRVSDAA